MPAVLIVLLSGAIMLTGCADRPSAQEATASGAAAPASAPAPEVAKALVSPRSPAPESAPAAAASSAPADPSLEAARDPRPEAARFREVTIPAGTTLTVQLTSGVSSKNSSVEDAVHATLRRPVVVNGLTVIPSGSAISGHVTEATRSGRVKGRARIGFRFTSLRTDGTGYDIRTASITRQARGTKKQDATKIGVGAGAGALVGALAGGKKGAAIGAAVGGGGGTGVVLATRGEEVALGPGASVTTRLTSPLVVRVRVP